MCGAGLRSLGGTRPHSIPLRRKEKTLKPCRCPDASAVLGTTLGLLGPSLAALLGTSHPELPEVMHAGLPERQAPTWRRARQDSNL